MLTHGTTYHKFSQSFVYADDVDLVAKNMNQLKENLVAFEKAAPNVSLKINKEKTQYY